MLSAEIRCRRAAACATREPVCDSEGVWQGQHQGGALSEPGLCMPCKARVAEALAQLPEDLAALSTQLPKPPPGGTGHETGRIALSSPSSSPPWRQGVISLMEDIHCLTVAWSQVLATHLCVVVPPQSRRWGYRVQVSCGLLRAHLAQFLALPDVEPGRDGISGAIELLWLHERAVTFSGSRRQMPRERVPCPSCGQLELRVEPDTGWARCWCGHRVAEHDLRAMTTASGLRSMDLVGG